jgi:hypothetical protein
VEEPLHLEADRRTVRTVVQDADVVAEALPAARRLALGDAAVLERGQRVVVGVVAQVETRALGRGGLLRMLPKGVTAETATPYAGGVSARPRL